MGNSLQLDIGNSSAKWRLVADGQIISRGRYSEREAGSLDALLGCADSLEQILISSVASPEREAELAGQLSARWSLAPWFARAEQATGRLQNSYDEPVRMGVDRWLAMLGAIERKPGRVAVIDSGSALTIDIVAESGQHEGGYIIPGPELMERALFKDTDRVRFAESADYQLHPGCSTAEAVRNGIAVAQAGSVAMVLQELDIDASQAVFCGGGSPTLLKLLGCDSDSAPDLVFEGLEFMAAIKKAGGQTDIV
jgi:type III pantothenate kinase